MALAARVFHSEGDTLLGFASGVFFCWWLLLLLLFVVVCCFLVVLVVCHFSPHAIARFAVGHGQHVQVLKHVGAALFGARTWRTRLAASEDAEAASEEEEGEEEEGEDAVSNESQGEKKQYKPRVGLTPALFPELGVADNSDPKKMAGLIAAIFRGDSKLHPGEHRAVDLILKKPDARGKLIYILSYLPKGQNISSQVLPRNRARQARVRVIKNFPVAVPETPDSEVLVAASTDPKKLMRSLEKRLVGAQVANNQTLVQMQMQGDRAASQAMLALESLYFDTWREVTFMPHFLRNLGFA
ncbi:unnamed protein product [Polarella glacialis]|uniref:Uncharacterized protein n=1 Tax=Polarella glacialis TaxID=89957 RepID=A0A813K3D6_POLGL|nr:unnamed protein product [Polarella glacialis]